MTTPAVPARRHPALWIPTLFFAEGLPYWVVAAVAALMYKNRGVSNEEITFYTGLLGFVWVFKPLWSPFLEAFGNKKSVIVLFELAGGVSLALVALALPLPGYFRYSIALLAVTSFCSATHDIAADGLYIGSLSAKQQAAYSGWLGAAFNLARIFARGGLVVLAGSLVSRMGLTRGWMVVFGLLAVMMVLLGLYHSWALPPSSPPDRGGSARGILATLQDVIVTFFQKKDIWLMLAFILLFRLGEGQVVTIGGLFQLDPRSNGGLGLSTEQVGTLGAVTALAFVLGSIAGGYFTSWLGLRRALFILICVMNLPNLAYVYLSAALPTNLYAIGAALTVEWFGYGFGFVGLTLFMMQDVAPGRYQTAHYSLATGVMQLGMVLSTMASGHIQQRLGYRTFFIWVLIAAVPALLVSRLLPFRGGAAADAGPAPEPSPAA